jgi:hypothetical protein
MKKSLFVVRTIRNTNTVCELNAEFWYDNEGGYVNAGGTYSNQWSLKGSFPPLLLEDKKLCILN